ncbi:MAG: alpha/beta hydrolase [Candidatus Nanopelagicales bacterium]
MARSDRVETTANGGNGLWLDRPAGPLRSAVVVLHGAEAPGRDYFLYAHLAEVLAPRGVVVVRDDRRPSVDGRDVPLATQAEDALRAVTELRAEVGDVPVGLWGWSQGAWAAALAAATAPAAVAYLICVSAGGVSPAAQMRFGTAQHLRAHGYGESDVADMLAVRIAVEASLRGDGDRGHTQRLLDDAATRPWFGLAYLPREAPTAGSWPDMDHDPVSVLRQVRCPALAIYGETDAWVPVEASIGAWRDAPLADVTVARLAGGDHMPTIGGGENDPISAEYTATLVRWLVDRGWAGAAAG